MHPQHLALIAPCFNEGIVVVRFLDEVMAVLAGTNCRWTVIIVDDASSDDTLQHLERYCTRAPNVAFRTITLAYNMGHQEAIYQGLLYASTTDATRFIVMDSDGEDDPAALPRLVELNEVPIAFVARGKRSESLFFKIGYAGYRLLFRAITGKSISFGNFSMIDRRVLQAVLDRSFIHYAAFLSRQRAPAEAITFDRRKRIDGRSKMSLKSLSMHAFRSMIEYSEEVLSLFLKGFVFLALVFLCSFIGILFIKFFTDTAIPGWASTLSVSLFNSMLLCLGFFATGLLLVNTAQRRDRAGRHLYKTVVDDARP